MQLKETPLEGLVEIIPNIFEDDRGYFLETYSKNKFKKLGIEFEFVQDNQSYSSEGTLRGLHFQHAPYAQAKLVRVVWGKALDVVVDIRPESNTFGQHYGCLLEADRMNMLMVPEGFAHGFLCLEDTVFSYKCSKHFHKEAESGLRWDDPALRIAWGIKDPLVSEKDQQWGSLADYKASVNTLS